MLCKLILLVSLVALVFSSETPTKENCPVMQNESIHLVMDRICEVCHEFSSHTQPNLRSECRSECFTTDTFRRCLTMFTPKRHSRHVHRHQHRA